MLTNLLLSLGKALAITFICGSILAMSSSLNLAKSELVKTKSFSLLSNFTSFPIAIAVSLDNGVNWHSVTSTDMNEVKSLLGIRFSNNIIESLLKK